MGAGDAVTVSMVWVGTGVGGVLIACFLGIWAAYRFVRGEREKGEDRIMAAVKAVEIATRAEDEKLHARISTVREETVRREDYHGDQQRMEGLLKAIGDDVRAGLRGLTERIDRMYTPNNGR